MKKYNVKNYVRYKEDVKASQPDLKDLASYERNELITKFLPLVENIARKFSTSQQASGVMSINDLIQEGSIGLVKSVDKLDYVMLESSEDKEKTLKILDKILNGETPKPGSYRGRVNNEPENNRKTLMDLKNA